jgi:hypothetical protein
MRRIIKWGMLVIFVGIAAYSATCAYANFIAPGGSSATPILKFPEVKTAQYSVTIENTGNVLFTSSYEQYGKVYVLHGYFELVGREFKYRNRDIILDEAIFGKVTVAKRALPVSTVTPGVQKPK